MFKVNNKKTRTPGTKELISAFWSSLMRIRVSEKSAQVSEKTEQDLINKRNF